MGGWGRHSFRSVSVTKGFKLGIICTGIDEILPGFKKALPTHRPTYTPLYVDRYWKGEGKEMDRWLRNQRFKIIKVF